MVTKHCRSYEEAEQVLMGWRFKYSEGTFDIRDYKKDKPLSFRKLAFQWLEIKEDEIARTSHACLSGYMGRAIAYWGDKNVKEIGYGEFEDLLRVQRKMVTDEPLAGKTKHEIKLALSGFWSWLLKRRVIRPHELPDFPEVPFTMSMRKGLDKDTQTAIIAEVKRISYEQNPKIWLGVLWLATYAMIRPGELRNIKERDVDLKRGVITIPKPKEREPKTLPLIPEDVELAREMMEEFPGFPGQYFFRSCKGEKGVQMNSPLSYKRLNRWWDKACRNLGVDGGSLYPGTKHSSCTALRLEGFSPEEIKQATGHKSSKAFERYYQTDDNARRLVFSKARHANTTKFKRAEESK